MIREKRLMIKYDGVYVPKEFCTIDRNGDADECRNCEDVCNNIYDGCEGCPIQKCFNKLTELEDKLENGTLIELPCKVGDTVYLIKNNKIHTKDVVYYNKIHSKIAEQNEEYWHCVDKDRISISAVTFYPDDFGKTVFLTREEAETRLKELQDGN